MRGRRVESVAQWLWVGRRGHGKVLHRETRVSGTDGIIPFVLVLLPYPWRIVAELNLSNGVFGLSGPSPNLSLSIRHSQIA